MSKRRNRRTFDMAGSAADNREILAYNAAAREHRVCPGDCGEITSAPGGTKDVWCKPCYDYMEYRRWRAENAHCF